MVILALIRSQQLMNPSPHFSFATFLEALRPHAWAFEEIAQKNAIQVSWEGMQFKVVLLVTQLSPPVQKWLASRWPALWDAQKRLGVQTDLWLLSEMITGGPKIFRPSLQQCLALEQISPRIPLDAYVQPYPAMIVESPEDYRRQRACTTALPAPQGTDTPEFVIVGTPPPPATMIWFTIFFSSSRRLRFMIRSGDATVEDGIVREFGGNTDPMAEPMMDQERDTVSLVVRVATNAMLLLTMFGCRSLGPVNPSHRERLEHFVTMAKKRGHGLPEAERNLRLASQLYGFWQEVVLHSEERTSAGSPGSGESHRQPHWRRGHVKTHAYGPGWGLRKLIFIKPVFVNRHLLPPGEGPEQTVYRLP
jgi:hypothetical protein